MNIRRTQPVTTAHEIADYLIWFSQEHGDPITNLKLQKLLYYAQGWFLALHSQRLFGEDLQAWQRGPAVYEVWKTYRDYRWKPITKRKTKPSLPDVAETHLIELMKAFGGESAYSLERMTHREPPWKNARGELHPEMRSKNVIRIEEIVEYFSKFADGKKPQAKK